MTGLVFCSYEVGGLPFLIAGVLNRGGVDTLYLSAAPGGSSHDSAAFHYGAERPSWALPPPAPDAPSRDAFLAGQLRAIGERHGALRCLATGRKSYLLREAGIPYLYWSYGADLDGECFGPSWPPRYPPYRKPYSWINFALTVRREARRSIRGAEAVMVSPYQAASLERVAPGKRLFFLPHILPVMPYGDLSREKLLARERVRALVGTGRYFFSATRQVWTERFRDWADLKSNDVIFRAFARYLAAERDGETRLVVVEKGPDVAEAKELTRRLGIAERVTWIPEVSRPRLADYYRGATACFGQFGNPVVTYAALEPLANGTPCISFFGDPHPPDVPHYLERPPLFNSREEGEIASFLGSLLSGEGRGNDLGFRSWDWVRTHCSEERFVQAFLEA